VQLSEEQKLLEFLSRGHFLPSFNLPIDAVPFVARTTVGGDEHIVARMSDGLEKALEGYAPGKEITYKKRDFTVGGIYIEYAPRSDVSSMDSEEAARTRTDEAINRTKLWFENDENINYFHMCKICKHTLPFNSTKPEEVKQLKEPCPVCKTGPEDDPWLSLPAIRPPGFAPLIRPTKNKGFSEVDNPDYSQDTKPFHSRTRWPSSLISDTTPERFVLADGRVEILYHKKIQILDINAGFGSISEPDSMGFAFCRDCGHMTPFKSIPGEHLRPYGIARDDGMYAGAFKYDSLKESFTTAMNSKCNSDNKLINGYSRLLLGRLFTTNVLSMKIKWDSEKWVTLNPEMGETGRELGERSAKTVCHALLQAISNAETNYAISSNDLGGDIRQTEDEGFEIFIYERVDGGAGLLKDVYTDIKNEWKGLDNRGTILTKMTKILSGEQCLTTESSFSDGISRVVSRPCDSICHGCLQDYTTQHITADLDRELGSQFFELGLGNISKKFNFNQSGILLKFLMNQLENSDKYEIKPIYDKNNPIFVLQAGQHPLNQDDIERNQQMTGLLVDGVELKIGCELIDSNNFNSSEIKRDPIGTMRKIQSKLPISQGSGDSEFEI